MLALITAILIAAPSPSPSPSAPPTLPNGTYTYAIRQGTTILGSAVISVANSDTGLKTHELASLMGRSFSVDQTLDATTMLPQSLEAMYPGAKPTGVHVKFGATAITETIDGMPGTKTLAPAAGAKGILALDGPVMSGFFLAPIQAKTTGVMAFTGISPGSESILPVTLDTAPSSARPASVPAADLGYTVTGLQSGSVTIWYDPVSLVPQDFEIPTQGISVPLVKQSSSESMNSVPPPAPTPLPTASPHFSSRDVAFKSSDGTRLAGTLTIPRGRTGAMPGVVLVHGSGPTTRDEQVGPNPIFLQISNALSNRGYVVLRYDKRGIGKSGGNARTTTRDQLLADAQAAIAYLAARPEVNRRAVFVVGHSEGGELAPSLAAGGAPLRGIALMAPPAIPLDQILLQQATLGLKGDPARKAADAQQHANTAIRTGVETMPGAIWLRSSFGIDPARVIAHVPCPILVLQGGKDFQVLPKDLPRLVNAAHAAHRDIAVRIFPNDDHLFITLPAGQQATLAEYQVPHHVDPAMIAALVAWLDTKK